MLLEKRNDLRVYVGNGVTLNIFPSYEFDEFQAEAVWFVDNCLFRISIFSVPMSDFSEDNWQKEVVALIKSFFESGEILAQLDFDEEDGVVVNEPFAMQKIASAQTKLFYATDSSLCFEVSLWDNVCFIEYRTMYDGCPVCFYMGSFVRTPKDQSVDEKISAIISDIICDNFFSDIQEDFPLFEKSPLVNLFELYSHSLKSCFEYAEECRAPEFLQEVGALKALSNSLNVFGFSIPHKDRYEELVRISEKFMCDD